MYTRIVIVSLLHAALARNVPSEKHIFRSNEDYVVPFNVRDATNEDPVIRSQETQYGTVGVHDFKSYSGGNDESEAYKRYKVEDGDGSENPLELLENKRITRDSNNAGEAERPAAQAGARGGIPGRESPSRRRYRAMINRSGALKADDVQDTLKTNVDSIQRAGNNKANNKESQVRKNKNPMDHTNINNTSQLTSASDSPPNTKTNIHRQSVDRNSNSRSVNFSTTDNPKSNTSDKAATDNEVNNKNKTDDSNVDRWVWSTVTAASVPVQTEKLLPDSDIDDRTSFNGDTCPAGEAKVFGKCTKTHNK